jgi:hypothetical protein
MEFKYESLKDSETHVFRLLPRTQGRDICGTIEHINLADTPSEIPNFIIRLWRPKYYDSTQDPLR